MLVWGWGAPTTREEGLEEVMLKLDPEEDQAHQAEEGVEEECRGKRTASANLRELGELPGQLACVWKAREEENR